MSNRSSSIEINQSLSLKDKNIIDRINLLINTVIFMLLIILVTLQVLIRVFSLPFTTNTEALARLLLILATYFAVAAASRNDEHIRFTIVESKLPDVYQHGLRIITTLFVVLCFSIMAYATYESMLIGWSNNVMGGRILGFRIKSGYIYLGITLALLWTVLYECLNLRSEVMSIKEFMKTSSDKKWM